MVASSVVPKTLRERYDDDMADNPFAVSTGPLDMQRDDKERRGEGIVPSSLWMNGEGFRVLFFGLSSM